jgi:hypothetical protein
MEQEEEEFTHDVVAVNTAAEETWTEAALIRSVESIEEMAKLIGPMQENLDSMHGGVEIIKAGVGHSRCSV